MVQEFSASHLKTLLHDLGSKLIGTVLSGEAENMLDSTTFVSGATVLADVLNAPVAELTMRDNVNTGEDFVDARTL